MGLTTRGRPKVEIPLSAETESKPKVTYHIRPKPYVPPKVKHDFRPKNQKLIVSGPTRLWKPASRAQRPLPNYPVHLLSFPLTRTMSAMRCVINDTAHEATQYQMQTQTTQPLPRYSQYTVRLMAPCTGLRNSSSVTSTELTNCSRPKPKVHRMWYDCFWPKPNVRRKCPFIHNRRGNRSRNSVDLYPQPIFFATLHFSYNAFYTVYIYYAQ